MLKQQRVPSGGQNRRINFDSTLLIAGLRYHLRDELGEEATAEPVRRALENVGRSGIHAAIRRSTWESLTDPQRLVWLLEVVQAEFKKDPESATVLQKVLGPFLG